MHTLILPGWQNSGPDHWQSRWEAQYGYQRVLQHDWMHPLRGDWITRLEDHVLSIAEHTSQELQGQNTSIALNNTAESTETQPKQDILLIAHSLGCHLVAAWAALSKSTHRIRGALLVAPPDCIREQLPQELKSWRAPVLQKLPFPSICVISSSDPFCDLQPGQAMAGVWGSRCIELGAKGHINADSGLGDWPQGQAWLAELTQV